VKKQRKAQFSNIIAAFFNGLVMELQLSVSRSKFETQKNPSSIMSSQAGDDSNQSWDILEPRLVQHNLVGQDVTLDRGDTDIHCTSRDCTYFGDVWSEFHDFMNDQIF
jgi:hypothetical protein